MILLGLLSTLFLLVLIIIAVTNIKNFRKMETYPKSTRSPFVSILVPARNEEANIEACVNSLAAQNYPNFEIIILDDESTDKTWDILKKISSRFRKVRIIKGKPLPEGWIGKPWACHQLVLASSGELLLFTDADTRHDPTSVEKAVSAFYAEGADFLTALPDEETRTLAEKLTIPIMPFGISTFFPMKIAQQSSLPAFSISVGQFMLFRRQAYEKIGGYEAVRECVLDDVEMGRRIKAAGLEWRIVDATSLVSCRMYTNLEEVFDGFSKNLFATFSRKILIYIPVWLWLSIVFILPVIVIGLALAGWVFSKEILFLSFLTVVLSLVVWSITHLRFRYPIYLTFLYPLSVFLWVLMAIRSMLATIARQNKWKGRVIETSREFTEANVQAEEEFREKPS